MRSSALAIVVAIFVAEVAITFESAMIYGAMPTLIRTFGDPLKAGWLVTLPMLVAAATYAIAGRLGDIRGRKGVLLTLLGISTAGSLLSALTTSYELVLTGRALQGFATAITPLCIGILRDALPGNRVPLAVGLMTTASGVGVTLGLVLGGAIIDHFNWHWLFAASAVLLGISVLAVAWVVPRDTGTPPRHPIDWIEGLLPAPAITAILLGLSWSKQYGWTDEKVIGLILLGLAILAYWARRSLRSPEPFIDVRLFATRDVAVCYGVAGLLAMGTTHIVYIFAAYIQSPAWTMVGLGLTATMAGLAKVPSNVLSYFAGPLSGWLTLTRGNRAPLLIGGVMGTVGWLAGMLLPNTLIQVILLLCVISFATTLMYAAIPNIIVTAVPHDRTSEAIGTMSVARGIFTAIGAQVIALILASSTAQAPIGGGAQFPTETAYRITMGWIAALTLCAGLLSLLLRNRMTIGKKSDETLAAEADAIVASETA